MLVVSLSAVNIVNLFFINRIEDYYKQIILNTHRGVYPPGYSSVYEAGEDPRIQQLYDRYGKLVLLWEVVLTLSAILLFYLLFSSSVKRERKYQEFLELIVLSVSHKFGNFLSALRLNLELIKSSGSERSLKSMEDYISQMENELKNLIEILKRTREENIQDISIEIMIENILSKLDSSGKRLKRNYRNIRIKGDINTVENILFILIHNSLKYSKSFIHIRTFKNKMVVIRNDIDGRGGGSGIGLLLAEKFCQLNGWKLKTRVSDRYFTAFLMFSPS